jgi:hypothetical protein
VRLRARYPEVGYSQTTVLAALVAVLGFVALVLVIFQR